MEIEGPGPYDWDGWEIWIELDPELEPENDGPDGNDKAGPGP